MTPDVLVDSSVWIGHWRNDLTPQVDRLRTMATSRIAVGDLTLFECPCGARDVPHARHLEHTLGAFPILAIVDHRVSVAAAHNHRTLRALGITTRKSIDSLIATFALLNGLALLHQDWDFDA